MNSTLYLSNLYYTITFVVENKTVFLKINKLYPLKFFNFFNFFIGILLFMFVIIKLINQYLLQDINSIEDHMDAIKDSIKTTLHS